MAKNIRHPEWRSSHEFTNFPFEHTATLQNEEGLVLLTGTFLDASLYPIGGTARLHLSKVLIESSFVRIYIGDANTDELAFTEFDFAAPPDVLHFRDNFDRPAGLLVSDAERLSLFAGWSAGEHRFTADETAFVARCCIPVPAVGFRGFELEDGSIISGDIRLIADNGIIFTLDQLELPATPDEAAQSVNVIRVDIVGDCLSRRKLCVDDDAFETPRLLQTLRVSSPAASGESSPVTAEGDPDILFLVDSSWSLAGRFWSLIYKLLPDAVAAVNSRLDSADIRWALADYKDFEDGSTYLTRGYNLVRTFTSSHTAFLAAGDTIPFSVAADEPQQQLFALKSIAENWTTTLGGREQARKIIVWIGVSTGWADGAKGHPYPTLQQTVDSLVTAGVKTNALNYYAEEAGLDSDSQASTIVAETEGEIIHSLTGSAVYGRHQEIIQWLADVICGDESGQQEPVWSREQIDIDCLPDTFGNISITAGSLSVPDTVLRIRPSNNGLIIEAVGRLLGDIR